MALTASLAPTTGTTTTSPTLGTRIASSSKAAVTIPSAVSSIDPVTVMASKDPELAARVKKTRDSLYSSAKTDQMGLCKTMDGFFPYGIDVECRLRQFSHDASPFRKGIVYVFQHDLVTGQSALSLRAVDGIAQMLAYELNVPLNEARARVAGDFTRAYGKTPEQHRAKVLAEASKSASPTRLATASEPTVTATQITSPTRVITSPATATTPSTSPGVLVPIPPPLPMPQPMPQPMPMPQIPPGGVTPMPRPTGPSPFQDPAQNGGYAPVCPEGQVLTEAGCAPLTPPQPQQPPAQPSPTPGSIQVAGTEVPYWALGVGGLALAGGLGFFFFGRKKGRRR